MLRTDDSIYDNAKRLKKCGMTETNIPDEFTDSITFLIMNEPVSLDPHINQNGEMIHSCIIDRSFVDQLLKDTRGNTLHPLRIGQAVSIITPLPDLKKRIDDFLRSIEKKQQKYLHLLESATETEEKVTTLKKSKEHKQISELVGLDDIFNRVGIPLHFKGDFSGKNLLEYPVLLDNDYHIDYDDLTKWWNINPSLKYHHPKTEAVIKSMGFDEELYKKIFNFRKQLSTTLVGEMLREQLDAVNEFIKLYHHPLSPQQRLERLRAEKEDIPQEFIGTNFVECIMHHPVVLDNEHHVDFVELQSWWTEENNLYKNYYTDKFITSIEYDVSLKLKIEAFIKLKQNPDDINKHSNPEPEPKPIKRVEPKPFLGLGLGLGLLQGSLAIPGFFYGHRHRQPNNEPLEAPHNQGASPSGPH